MKNEKKYFDLALAEAKKGVKSGHGGPFGAVIVKDNKIIASAHNEVVKKKDPTCHAEIQAIRKACKKIKSFKLDKCVLYSTCEPCPMCLAAILWAGIKETHYGCTKEDAAKIGFKDNEYYRILNYRAPKKILLNNEKYRLLSLKIFKDWRKKKSRVNY